MTGCPASECQAAAATDCQLRKSLTLMLQDFHKILDLKDYWDKSIQLGVWISSYLQSDCPDIAAAARTVKHWKGMILNSWKYLRSNGPAEGLNNKIKVIKRVSFGMHRFDLFRKRILLVCGSMTPSNEYIRIHWNHLNGKKGMS